MSKEKTLPRELIASRFSSIQILNTLVIEGDEGILEFLTLAAVAEVYCANNEVQIEESSVDLFVDLVRRRKKLFTADDTERFLSANGLSDQDLQNHAKIVARIEALKESVAPPIAIADYFRLNKLMFDEVELYKLVVKSSSAAAELETQITEGSSFCELAKRYSIDATTRAYCGYMGRVRRDTLPAQIQSRVFSKNASQLIGPVRLFGAYHLYFIEDVYSAELNDSTKKEIADLLLRDWLSSYLEKPSLSSSTITNKPITLRDG